MDIEIKVPSLGESESEATLVSWQKQPGDDVAEDDVLAEIESDKITMEITAFTNGVLKEVRRQEGDTVAPGEVIGLIEEGEQVGPGKKEKAATKELAASLPQPAEAEKEEVVEEAPQEQETAPPPSKPVKVVETSEPAVSVAGGKAEERVPMSRLRKTIARRLKEAQNTAAILTTFNEVNMQPVMDIRSRYKEDFLSKFDVKLGFMSFFVQACVEALKRFPEINASVDGNDIVYHGFYDVGVAVSGPNGLVVPVLHDADLMSLAQVEQNIVEFGNRAKNNSLTIDDITGGTFTISNGGVFGSMLSTPILNPPQSAILGMHNIVQRAMVVDGEIVALPIMYVALSYDHRLIDGKSAVQFLVTVKQLLEDPSRMLLGL